MQTCQAFYSQGLVWQGEQKSGEGVQQDEKSNNSIAANLHSGFRPAKRFLYRHKGQENLQNR
jgi:hypothetical protein